MRKILIGMGMMLLWVSCNENPIQKLEQLDQELVSSPVEDSDAVLISTREKKAEVLLSEIQKFISHSPDNQDAAEWMFRSGEIYLTELKSPAQAAETLEKTATVYPNHQVSAKALFMAAFIFNNELKNYAKAQELYASFTNKYPDHPLRNDAELELKFMGKSAEDFLPDSIR